jgi:hypothetical protein
MMMLGQVVERVAKKAPLSLMARVLMEHALAQEDLDRLFQKAAITQYQRRLLFSSLVDLMTVVVCKIQPAVSAAYREVAETLPVSLSAVYQKLARVEMPTLQALVRHVFERLNAVVEQVGAVRAPWVAGYRCKVLDGNHVAATERRLSVLWDVAEAPLPGQALVVYEPERDLVRDLFPCQDGHAQERSLLDQVLATVLADDLWVADRNFCTLEFLRGLGRRAAFFVIRHHAGLPIVSFGTRRSRGRIETGRVFEQKVTMGTVAGGTEEMRRIELELDTATRDGDSTMALLTNLPASVSAAQVASVYRGRWSIETMFQTLEQHLASEIDTLAYPAAALFGFSVAVCAHNVLATILGCLRVQFGEKKVDEEVSGYYVANEVRRFHEGLEAFLEEEDWAPLRSLSLEALGEVLLRWAAGAKLEKYKKTPRGPKKPAKPRTKLSDGPHISTAKLLLARKGRLGP